MTPIVWPGPGRISLVLLAVVPALMRYPWPSTGGRLLLGLAVAVLVALLGWWRGLHFTTILGRRLTLSRRRSGGVHVGARYGPDARSTVLLRVSSGSGDAPLPLPLIVGYLDRYGLRAHHIRITSRDNRSDGSGRQTWVGLTFSAAENLAALQARSASIPLPETAEVAARRLADHLREIGWEAAVVGSGDVGELCAATARETWTGISDDDGYIAGYQINVDNELGETFARLWAFDVPEIWTVLEFSGSPQRCTAAAGCALRTRGEAVGADPLSKLTAQRGHHRAALQALHPLSGSDLDGPVEVSVDGLAAIRWPLATIPAGRATAR